ncbi:uncharacterized protein LOC126179258 [Schistocerca cancellata]|uniref:uncharacterized protein LOC126179258 n=1 Tax=Schistocerca cancellata TaxID=274614 RepID=UPI002117C0E8|nr:uncharacterized protein LOC126179258 [Schistocerca cancellata]
MFSLRTKGRRYSSTLTASSGSGSECSVISVPKSRPRILIDGIDVTPEPLFVDIEDVFGSEYIQPDVSHDVISRRKAGTLTVSRAPSLKEATDSYSAEYALPQKQPENGRLDFQTCEQKGNSVDMLYGKKIDAEDKRVAELALPDKIVIRMRETLTFFLLDVPSTVAERDFEEGQRIAEDNELYDYLTKGEGQNRYTRDTEVQTVWTVRKSKATLAPMCAMKDNFAMASTYDLYKSFGNN